MKLFPPGIIFKNKSIYRGTFQFDHKSFVNCLQYTEECFAKPTLHAWVPTIPSRTQGAYTNHEDFKGSAQILLNNWDDWQQWNQTNSTHQAVDANGNKKIGLKPDTCYGTLLNAFMQTHPQDNILIKRCWPQHINGKHFISFSISISRARSNIKSL